MKTFLWAFLILYGLDLAYFLNALAKHWAEHKNHVRGPQWYSDLGQAIGRAAGALIFWVWALALLLKTKGG